MDNVFRVNARAGEASAGKTQLCLQLVLATVLHCDRWRAIYVHTEGDPPLKRLNDLTLSALSKYVSRWKHMHAKPETSHVMDKIESSR